MKFGLLFWLSLLPLDLLRISCCSKWFYVLSHQGQKYRERLEHSRRLVNSAKMDRIILLETQKVFKKICGIHIFFWQIWKKSYSLHCKKFATLSNLKLSCFFFVTEMSITWCVYARDQFLAVVIKFLGSLEPCLYIIQTTELLPFQNVT